MSFLLTQIAIANFASFVEAGTVAGEEENVVSRDWYPDAEEDLGVYSSTGCLLQVVPDPKVEDDPIYCPQPDGTYRLEDNPTVVQDAFKISCKCHFEIIHRLVWGLKNKIVNNTVQAPFANSKRWVEGWLMFEQRVPGGVTIVTAALYVQIFLDGSPTWSKDVTRPAIRVVNVYSPIASLKPNGIAA